MKFKIDSENAKNPETQQGPSFFIINLIEKKARLSKDLSNLESEVNLGENSAYYKNISNYFFGELKKRFQMSSSPTESSSNMKLISSRYIQDIIDYFNIMKKSFELFMIEHETLINSGNSNDIQYFYSYSLVEFKLMIEDLLNDLLLPSFQSTSSRVESSTVTMIRSVLRTEQRNVFFDTNDAANPNLKDPRLLSFRKNAQEINLQIIDFNKHVVNLASQTKELPFNEKDYKKIKYKLVKDLIPCDSYSQSALESAQPIVSAGILELDVQSGEVSIDIEEGELPKRLDHESSSMSSCLLELNTSRRSVASNKTVLNTTKEIPIDNLEGANANNSWLLSLTSSSMAFSPPKTPVYHPTFINGRINPKNYESSTPNMPSILNSSSKLQARNHENNSNLLLSSSFDLSGQGNQNEKLHFEESSI
jgi:hypothetical protein